MKYIYKRKAYYHETDQMAIIHHSNYIKWLEEARIDFMKQIGVSYRKMEEESILIPVLNVTLDYKTMVKFDDYVFIHVWFKKYNGIRFTMEYVITNEDESIIYSKGSSKHCFFDYDKNLLALSKEKPELHEKFMNALE